MPEYLPVSAYAAQIGTKPATVRGWIESGKLRAIPVGSGHKRKHYRIPLDAIREFETGCRCQPPAKSKPPGQRRPTSPDYIQYY